MEFGITCIDIVLAVILVAFIVIAIVIDSRNVKRNRRSKLDVRKEIQNRVTRKPKKNKKKS